MERNREFYLHLGGGATVLTSNVVGVFDLDTASAAKITRAYLETAEKRGGIVNIAEDIPRSFVLCEQRGKPTVYLSQISSQTLLKRSLGGAYAAEQP